jgi:hypothetical protein
VANTQWLDKSQPQTLYLANMLLYINAVWWVLYLFLGNAFFGILAVGAIFAGLGLANEKKAGYWGAIVVAVLNLFVLVQWFFASPASIGIVISLMFAIVLLALLLHPMTRSYERIWFKRLSRGR